jgi:hypothetical protein
MRNVRYFLPLFCLLLAAPVLMAQTARQQAEEDFIRISKKYKKQDKYKMNLVYLLYADSAPASPVSEVNGVVIVNGPKKYQKVGDMESYFTERYSLVLNHSLKTLSFMPANPAMPNISGGDFQELQQFIQQCDSISYADTKTERVYSFNGLVGNYNKIEVAFNRKTATVNSIRLISVHRSSSVLVTYSDISTKAIPGEEWFSYTNFLTYDNKSFKCKAPFESYELFNQITNPEIIK